jgi:hypothetical protein
MFGEQRIHIICGAPQSTDVLLINTLKGYKRWEKKEVEKKFTLAAYAARVNFFSTSERSEECVSC